MKIIKNAYPRKGQALIEFIFICFIFYSFIFVTLNLALIINAKLMLNAASFIAARDFAVNRSDTSARNRASTFLKDVGLTRIANFNYVRKGGEKFGAFTNITVELLHKNFPLEIVTDFFGEATHLEGTALTLRE